MPTSSKATNWSSDRRKLIAQAREWERKEFAEFAADKIHMPPNSCYFHFGPSWHIQAGLVDGKILESIRLENKQVLSVGAGKAYLEQFMVRGIGIDPTQITLSDIEAVMPEGFSRFTFNMYQKWPKFEKAFDYVLFPESISINLIHYEGDYWTKRTIALHKLIGNAAKVLRPYGQIRMCLANYEDIVDRLKYEPLLRNPDLELEYLKEGHNDGLLVVRSVPKETKAASARGLKRS